MKCRKLAGKPNISCKKKNTERRVGVHPHKLFGGNQRRVRSVCKRAVKVEAEDATYFYIF